MKGKQRLVEKNLPYQREIEEKVEELKRSNQELISLNSIITTASQSLSLNDTLNKITDQLFAFFRPDAISLYLLDQDSGELISIVSRGIASDVRNGSPQSRPSGEKGNGSTSPLMVLKDAYKSPEIGKIYEE
ncbi:MAG: hypothetical protein HY731_02860, partial [Candidatus Tectomicrobia bacterium]|nr:hypothetical protein [Candidatus Tectomicrobia bacterium]